MSAPTLKHATAARKRDGRRSEQLSAPEPTIQPVVPTVAGTFDSADQSLVLTVRASLGPSTRRPRDVPRHQVAALQRLTSDSTPMHRGVPFVPAAAILTSTAPTLSLNACWAGTSTHCGEMTTAHRSSMVATQQPQRAKCGRRHTGLTALPRGCKRQHLSSPKANTFILNRHSARQSFPIERYWRLSARRVSPFRFRRRHCYVRNSIHEDATTRGHPPADGTPHARQ